MKIDKGNNFLAALILLLLAMIMPASVFAQETGTCPAMSPEDIYAKLKQETLSHKTYTAVFQHDTQRGARHELWVKVKVSGRYIQDPGKWCETRLALTASFPEQAGAGYQECYSVKDEINRVLMPGAYRALGVISMFAEDPKSSYLNGENMNNTAVWMWFKIFDRLLEGGQLTAECKDYKGAPTWVLRMARGTNPDPLYHHQEIKVFVDPKLWFPVRKEVYVAGDPRPVQVYEFEEVKLDVPLTEDDVDFEGLAPGWNLVSVPGGEKLDGLKAEEPKIEPVAGLDPAGFMARLDAALAGVKDYTTDLTLELRYRRLRQYRQDTFQFLMPASFSEVTRHLEANYMQINSGEGFRTVYDPSRDQNLHVLPAGVYALMGEQTFPLNDPRIFSALGDDITGLNFFALRDELKRRFQTAAASRAGRAIHGDISGPWIEVTSPDLGIPASPTVMRVLLDDAAGLPARLDYRGYEDREGYITVRFANTKVNNALTPAGLWE